MGCSGRKRNVGTSLYNSSKNWRRVGHIISDKVYERLTGEKGYFDTRIIYVSEEGPNSKNKKISNNGSRWI